MKRVFLSFVVLWFAAIFGANCQDASITVKVKYSENGKIIPHTDVYFLYQKPGEAVTI